MNNKVLASLLPALLLSLQTTAVERTPMRLVTLAAEDTFDSCRNFQFVVLDEAWVQRMGLSYQCEALPWKRAQQMVREQQRDGMITLATEERAQYTVRHQVALITNHTILVASRHHPRLMELGAVKQLSDLKGFHVVTYLGDGWTPVHLEPLGVHIDWAPDMRSVLRKVAIQHGDFFLAEEDSVWTEAASLHLGDELIALTQPLASVDYHLLLQPNSLYVTELDRLDKTLLAMQADGSIARLHAQFLANLKRSTH